MPTYQYHCPSCGHDFEEFQPITDDPLETCPACGEKTHRVISGGGGFLFKGSGFYITDYRSKQYKKDAAKEKPSVDSSSSTSSSPSGNTTKPAASSPAPDKSK